MFEMTNCVPQMTVNTESAATVSTHTIVVVGKSITVRHYDSS